MKRHNTITLPETESQMRHAHRLNCVIVAWLCLLAAPTDGYLVASLPERQFAQAFVWSRWDQGQRLGIGVGRSNLWYGQPLELTVAAPPVVTASPEYRHVFLRVWWENLNEQRRKTATVELTDRSGTPIEHRLTVISMADSVASGHRSVVRLTPRKTPGGSMYFPPGNYRLRVRVHMDEADADANSYVGTLLTPWIDLEIWSTEPESRDERLEEYRTVVEKQFNDATTPGMRRALEHRLRNDLFAPQYTLLIPALETIATSEDEANAEVAKRQLRNLLFPIVQLNRPFTPYSQDTAIESPTLGVIGEPSWELIREFENGDELLAIRTKAASHSPLPPHVNLADPTDEQIKDLANRLRDDRFETRMAAVRSVGHTTDPRIIALLVERFDDPYNYVLHGMPGMPVPTHPVAGAAMWQVSQLGETALPVLLEFADKFEDRGRWRVEQTLLRIGPHPDVLAYFGEMLKANEPRQRHTAIHYLRQLRPRAAPLLRPLAEDHATDTTMRRLALDALATVDPSEETAELLRDIVSDAGMDDAIRQSSMHSLIEIAPTGRTRKLLQEIATSKADPLREIAAQRLDSLDR